MLSALCLQVCAENGKDVVTDDALCAALSQHLQIDASAAFAATRPPGVRRKAEVLAARAQNVRRLQHSCQAHAHVTCQQSRLLKPARLVKTSRARQAAVASRGMSCHWTPLWHARHYCWKWNEMLR